MTTLTTDRLILRLWREDDRPDLAALNADAAVMRYFQAPLSRAQSDAFMDRMQENWARDGFSMFAVTRQDGGFLGAAGLMRPNFEASFTPCVEVGWRFARHAWGQGYATEAAHAALGWGFATHGPPEIVSFTALPNTPSERVMQRLGMRRDPRDFDHPNLPEGHGLRRHMLYRLRLTEWEALP